MSLTIRETLEEEERRYEARLAAFEANCLALAREAAALRVGASHVRTVRNLIGQESDGVRTALSGGGASDE